MAEKQELKHIWLQCLKGFFEEAEKDHKPEIEISALDLQHRAKKKFPGKNYERFRSICYAMKSILENNDEENEDGKFNSSTYTIKYKLPRINPIKFESTTANNGTEYVVKHKSVINNLYKEKNINPDEIQNIVMDYYTQRNPEHRYSSFDYCYNYFFTTSDLTEDMEKSCLQIGFYLASWGMLRNSDLLQKSTKYYHKLIEYIDSLNDDDWKIDVDKYNDEPSLERLLDIYNNIKDILGGTITRITRLSKISKIAPNK